MTDRSQPEGSASDPVFEGVYGPFTITDRDRREVLGYRLALLGVAIVRFMTWLEKRLLHWQ